MTPTLKSSLSTFADWQLAAFTAALAERMFPNYALFARVSETGSAEVMRMALDKVWDRLSQRGARVNFETQMERVEGQIPDVDDHDMYGVYPALDAAVAICAAINQLQQASIDEALNISQLSEECVATYLEIIAEPELSDEELVRFIGTHELMQQELEFRQQLVEHLQAMQKPQASRFDALRELAANQGVSNIGICVDD